MASKAERYFAAKEEAQKEARKLGVQPLALEIEELEPAAPAVVRTPEQSEAEWRELMTGPNAPEWAKAADPSAHLPAPPVDLSILDGSVLAEDVATPEAYKAAVEAIEADYKKELEKLGEENKRKLHQLLTARRALEIEEQKELERSTAGRLKDVLQAMREAKDAQGRTVEEANAAAAAEADAAEEKALRDSVAPVLATADEVAKGLHLWASQFKSTFEELDAKSLEAYVAELPTGTSKEIQTATRLVFAFKQQITLALTLYQNGLDTQARCRQEIESIISHRRHQLGHQEMKRELNQSVHELAMISPESVEMLNKGARSVATMLEAINTLRQSVVGTVQPEVKWENRGREIEAAKRAEELTKRGHDRPVARADWNPLQ